MSPSLMDEDVQQLVAATPGLLVLDISGHTALTNCSLKALASCSRLTKVGASALLMPPSQQHHCTEPSLDFSVLHNNFIHLHSTQPVLTCWVLSHCPPALASHS